MVQNHRYMLEEFAMNICRHDVQGLRIIQNLFTNLKKSMLVSNNGYIVCFSHIKKLRLKSFIISTNLICRLSHLHIDHLKRHELLSVVDGTLIFTLNRN